ncbi:MAG: type II toxin-antitoxin system PemK/MazF family toxin [Treponema sp.]|nr:type II toxin-antitoxin system PemK/MazF family toxin [Treponema sp.]
MILSDYETLLSKASVAVTPQIIVIDKARLLEKISELSDSTMRELAENIQLVLGI